MTCKLVFVTPETAFQDYPSLYYVIIQYLLYFRGQYQIRRRGYNTTSYVTNCQVSDNKMLIEKVVKL